MSFANKVECLLDDEETYRLYAEIGSFQKVSEFLAEQGRINPKTGKPFTDMGIWHSVYRWGLSHMDQMRADYKKQGVNPDTSMWEKRIILTAKIVYGTSRDRFLDWVEENGFMKYSRMFDDILHDGGEKTIDELRPLEELI
jgi:hypothetical protein